MQVLRLQPANPEVPVWLYMTNNNPPHLAFLHKKESQQDAVI